jgi:hypothetical protein
MKATLALMRWLAILTLVAVPFGWSQRVAITDPALQEPPARRLPPLKIPLRLYWGYLVVVEGSIGRFQKLNFLIDTGTFPSVVNEGISHGLDLQEKDANVNLSNRSIRTKSVLLPSIQLGPVRAELFPVLMQDLSFLEKGLGCKVDAIVGMDVLRKSSFSIDYKRKQILFGPIENVRFSVPFETSPPYVTIRMELQNGPVRLLIDTGDPALMLFQSRLRDAIGLQTIGLETGNNLGGQFQRRKVRVSEITLGKEKLAPQVAFIVNDQVDRGRNFDGVLGPRGLQFEEIAFDFEGQRFSWK